MVFGSLLLLAGPANAQGPIDASRAAATVTAGSLERIRDTAMQSDWAYRTLQTLTDQIGPRLSGSPQLEAAILRLAAVMRELGATVTLQPVKVPHWERGLEQASLVSYPGQVGKLEQKLHLTALGGSGSTPPGGAEAPVLVLRDFTELEQRAGAVRGAIVLFTKAFDQNLADNGLAGQAYEQAGQYRFSGPAAAAALGASAVLVRSVGPAGTRLPHTGATTWKEGQSAIPAAALASEDADLIERLAQAGPVRLHLLLTPRTLPDADSFNVIADWPGTTHPEQVVVVSGHLDSWDLATGALDDGVGVIGAAGVLQVLQQLGLHAQRTIRFIAWTNEENGTRGAKAYAEAQRDHFADHIAAIESDEGGGRALGIRAAVSPASAAALKPVLQVLAPIGATGLERRDSPTGADITPLQRAGVPGFAPLVDARHYFDLHHTAADTFDKVDALSLRSHVATLAVLAWWLAEHSDRLQSSVGAP